MYAVIQTGAKQFKVKSGDLVDIELLDAKIGETVKFEDVLAIGEEGGKATYGAPLIAGASVSAEVIDIFRAKKIIAFKMHRRKSYRRTIGHRQNYLKVQIGEIVTK